eukprot:TRINITY_DN6494_c0_g1_i4.p1 TRINITY_DN6494_c0_g1~~TRINITY_DN6494_c0_g1_i4.p1  ORF type:complete len:1660 (+),score=326.99 TRINITY_DN6494_c0_g1_i4:120-5099(+)
MASKLIITFTLIAFVKGGIPECTSQIDQCEIQVDENFGDAMTLLRNGEWKQVKADKILKAAVCDPTNWERSSTQCGPCPLNLEITEPAVMRGVKICLQQNDFVPYNADTHVDKYHSVNGREMELITSGYHCYASEWPTDGKDKIAFILDERNDCWNGSPLPAAVTGDYEALILIQGNFLVSKAIVEFPGYKFQNRPTQVGDVPAFGWSHRDGTIMGDVIVAMAQEHPDVTSVLEMVQDPNTVVKGKITLECDAQNTFNHTESYYSDSCPTEYLIGTDICEYQHDDAHRLCSRCPVELFDPQNTTAPIGCLYGPDMTPFKRQNFFEPSFGDSDAVTGAVSLDMDIEVYLVSDLDGTRLMCKPETWPTVTGRIIAISTDDPYNMGCNYVQVVEAAQAAGAAGIILLNTKLPGLSSNVNIPIGSTLMHPAAVKSFISDQQMSKTELNGTSRVIRFRSGVLSKNVYQPPEEIIIPEEDDVNILEEPGVLVCVIVAPFMLLATVAKAWHTSSGSIELPHSEGIPLKAAVIGLTVTLSLITAGVTLVLGVSASQDALDTSSADSQVALDITNTNSEENVKSLTVMVMTEIIQGGIAAYNRWEESGAFFLRASASFMEVNGDYYLWNEFYGDFAKSLIKMVHADKTGWRVQAYTDAGMYYDNFALTNSLHQQDANGSLINVTNDGWRYDYMSRFSFLVKREFFDPYMRISTSQLPTGYDTALNFTRHVFQSHTFANHISQYNWQYPSGNDLDVSPFYSLLYPLISYKVEDKGSASVTGALAASMSVEKMSQILREGMSSSSQESAVGENMTIALFRLSDGILLAADSEDLYERVSYFKGIDIEDSNVDTPFFTTKLHNVYDTPSTVINSFVKVCTSEHGTLDPDVIKGKLNIGSSDKVTMEFNQNGFEAPDPTIIRIDFDNSVVDTSIRKFATELRGTCATCYQSNGVAGGYLTFDGNMSVQIHPFITTRTDYVAETQKPTSTGEWSSSVQMLNMTATVGSVPDVVVVYSSPTANYASPLYGNVFNFMQSFSISVFVNPSTANQEVKESDRPKIISDTSSGDGALRWYADGMLKISVVRHGCSTSSLDIPQGRWSQLTAVVSFPQKYCAVYLNGVEVSRGKMTAAIELPLYTSGYTLGEHFVGGMDLFKVYRRTLTSNEVAYIYENPTATTIRQSDKQWSVVLDSVGEASSYGGKLVLVAMIPTKDITKSVDENNALVSKRLSIQDKNTQTKLDANQIEAAAAVLFILVAATFFVLLFTDYVTKPFAVFARSIYSASTMDVEEEMQEDDDMLSYPIKELQVMQAALSLLMSNLQHFKSFVPLNLVEDIGAAAGYEDASMVDDSSAAPSRRSALSQGVGNQSSKQSHRLSGSDSGSSTFKQNGYITKLQPLTQLSLQKKKSSFLQINILDWHAKMYGDSDTLAPVLVHHASYLSNVITFVMNCKGVPDTFSGDRILAAYNSVKPCQAYQLAACTTALKVRASFSESMNLSMSVVSATCKAGYMGPSSMKRYSYIGPVIGWSFALERLSKQLRCGILADQLVGESITGHILYRTRGAATYRKHSRTPIRFHELLEHIELAHDEWMYMLDKAQSSPINLWNKTFDKVISQQWAEAENCYSSYVEALATPQPTAVFSFPTAGPVEDIVRGELEGYVKNHEYTCFNLDPYY